MTKGTSAPIISNDIDEQESGARAGKLSVFSCPDCGGVLWQIDDDEFTCHIGHSFPADYLVVAKSRAFEQAVIEAVRALKEKAMLLRQLGLRINAQSPATALAIEQADQDDEDARLLQRYLLHDDGTKSSTDTTVELMAEIAKEMQRPADD